MWSLALTIQQRVGTNSCVMPTDFRTQLKPVPNSVEGTIDLGPFWLTLKREQETPIEKWRIKVFENSQLLNLSTDYRFSDLPLVLTSAQNGAIAGSQPLKALCCFWTTLGAYLGAENIQRIYERVRELYVTADIPPEDALAESIAALAKQDQLDWEATTYATPPLSQKEVDGYLKYQVDMLAAAFQVPHEMLLSSYAHTKPIKLIEMPELPNLLYDEDQLKK